MTKTKEKSLTFKKALIHCAAEMLEEFRTGVHKENIARRIEVKLNPGEKLAWLKQQELYPKMFWADREETFAVAGCGAAELLQANPASDTDELFRTIRAHLPEQGEDARFYGGMCFDEGKLSSEWQKFGAYQFILPRFEWISRPDGDYFACNFFPHRDSPARLNDLLTRMAYRYEETITDPPELPVLRRRLHIPSLAKWKPQVKDALKKIAQRKFQKVVLARQTSLIFEGRADPYHLLTALMKETSQCFPFIFQLNDWDIFLGASPERLYKREKNLIFTEAIAGTRPRGEDEAEDQALGEELQNSKKDLHEHRLVARMLTTQLKKLCGQLKTDEDPSLLQLKSGHHLISRFEGELKKNISDGRILNALHPTPAVAGTPTETALRYIRKAEPFSRGWYAGPFGYIGKDTTEFVAAIRSGLLTNNELHLFAGAGIVKGSDPDEEWQEVEDKLGTFLNLFRS